MERHYGMDWLRIGAFAVLILYHIGMVFVPWGFHVKAVPTLDWATIPMLFPSAWRLLLLFLVSGYASRALLAKQPGALRFAGSRTARLLVPLLFGMIVIIPPQVWVELATKHRYDGGYLWFWAHDYFRFGRFHRIDMPTWNHLWFVAYLWLYTLALTVGVALIRGEWLQRLFDRIFGGFGGWLLMALPTAWLLAIWLVIVPDQAETHALFGDWVAHLMYLPAFLFGFGLRGSPAAMAQIARWWKVGAVVGLLAFVGVAIVEIIWMGRPAPPFVLTEFRTLRAFQAWGSIIALIGIAELYWNRDHRWRPMLTEAVFPFYIIHQTVIVVVAWALLQLQLPQAVDFVVLVVATVAGCWLFYLGGREIQPLRPLIGLRWNPPKDRRALPELVPAGSVS